MRRLTQSRRNHRTKIPMDHLRSPCLRATTFVKLGLCLPFPTKSVKKRFCESTQNLRSFGDNRRNLEKSNNLKETAPQPQVHPRVRTLDHDVNKHLLLSQNSIVQKILPRHFRRVAKLMMRLKPPHPFRKLSTASLVTGVLF